MFAHRHIVVPVLLMHAAKGTQKVSQRLPQAFNRVDVNLTDAIAIIVARPLSRTMTDGRVPTVQLVVALPLVAVTGRASGDELLHVPVPRLLVSALCYSQAAVAVASDSSDDRRAVILVCTVTPFLIGSTTRRISLVLMLFSFFPPRSETSRRFQSGSLSRASLPTSRTRSLANACARYEHSGERATVLQLRPENFHLCRRRAGARRPVAGASCCQKRWCHDKD